MKCERCGQREATIRIKQVLDGEASEATVCGECAVKGGFDTEFSSTLAELLFEKGSRPEGKRAERDRVCPACHMRSGDFRKTSRLGCPQCYTAFAEDLAGLLEGMHRGLRHVGKRPAGAAGSDVRGTERALAAAVAAQNFEEAARLRDQLKVLSQASADRSEEPR